MKYSPGQELVFPDKTRALIPSFPPGTRGLPTRPPANVRHALVQFAWFVLSDPAKREKLIALAQRGSLEAVTAAYNGIKKVLARTSRDATRTILPVGPGIPVNPSPTDAVSAEYVELHEHIVRLSRALGVPYTRAATAYVIITQLQAENYDAGDVRNLLTLRKNLER